MKNRRVGMRLLWAGLILVALAFAVPIGLNALGAALIVDDPLHPADAILVLAGESREGDRVRHAVELFKRGLAPLLVLSGTPMGFRTHEADVMRRHAEYLGVPPVRILTVRHDSDSTKEEAGVVVPILKRRGLKEVILVTANYHTARAKRIFEGAAGPYGPHFLASPVDDGLFNPERWWMRRRYAKTFVYEAIKTVWSAIEVE
ncbi:MAG TPA: YdcF family protein [Nitrospirales bacterium]|nr:YdcF family protein [Nitrospirales bacterium]